MYKSYLSLTTSFWQVKIRSLFNVGLLCMKRCIYIFLIMLSGCANYNAPQSNYSPKQSDTNNVVDPDTFFVHKFLSGSPNYQLISLRRQQMENKKQKNERVAKNEIMHNELVK